MNGITRSTESSEQLSAPDLTTENTEDTEDSGAVMTLIHSPPPSSVPSVSSVVNCSSVFGSSARRSSDCSRNYQPVRSYNREAPIA